MTEGYAEIIGFLALMIGLTAMGMKRMLWLRALHGSSAVLYIVYGLMIEAYPLIVGGFAFLTIHIYHIFKLTKALKP